MEHILHSLTDEELSRLGRIRQECASMRDKEIQHRHQISTLEDQNRQLRSGNDALLCELRVAEADFRIQQNMINDVFYLTEETLKSLGVDINSHTMSFETHIPIASPPRNEVVRHVPIIPSESRSVNVPHRRTENPPGGAAPTVDISFSSAAANETEKKLEKSSALNVKSSLKASATKESRSPAAPVVTPAPELDKEPLTPEETKARANALRRSQLKKPVCWLFQEGRCTSGAQCRESHDTVPFEFCRAYNDTGVCPNRATCVRKHVLFDYEQSMKDASEPLKHRQIDPTSAAQAAEAWKLNLEERERLEKVRQKQQQRHRTVYTPAASEVTYSTLYQGQAAMDRAAQEQRERERVQKEARAARQGAPSSSSNGNGSHGNNDSNGSYGSKR